MGSFKHCYTARHTFASQTQRGHAESPISSATLATPAQLGSVSPPAESVIIDASDLVGAPIACDLPASVGSPIAAKSPAATTSIAAKSPAATTSPVSKLLNSSALTLARTAIKETLRHTPSRFTASPITLAYSGDCDAYDGRALLDAAIDTLRMIAEVTVRDPPASDYAIVGGVDPLYSIRHALQWAATTSAAADATASPEMQRDVHPVDLVPWTVQAEPPATLPAAAEVTAEPYSNGGYIDGYVPATGQLEALEGAGKSGTPSFKLPLSPSTASGQLVANSAPLQQQARVGSSHPPPGPWVGGGRAAGITTNSFRRNRWYIAAAAAAEGLIASPHTRRVHARAAYSRGTGTGASDGAAASATTPRTHRESSAALELVPSPLMSPAARTGRVPAVAGQELAPSLTRGASSPATLGRHVQWDSAAQPPPASPDSPVVLRMLETPASEASRRRQSAQLRLALWPAAADDGSGGGSSAALASSAYSLNDGSDVTRPSAGATFAAASAARVLKSRYGGRGGGPRAAAAAAPPHGASATSHSSRPPRSQQLQPPPSVRFGVAGAARKRGFAPAAPPPAPPAAPAVIESRLAGALAAAAPGSAASTLLRAGSRGSFGAGTPAPPQPQPAAASAASASACLCTATGLGLGTSTTCCADCGAAFGALHLRWAHEHCGCCGEVFCADCVSAAHPLLAAPVPPLLQQQQQRPRAPPATLRLCAGCAFSVGATDAARGGAVAAASQAALGTGLLGSPAGSFPGQGSGDEAQAPLPHPESPQATSGAAALIAALGVGDNPGQSSPEGDVY